jgi:hypothetical protein
MDKINKVLRVKIENKIIIKWHYSIQINKIVLIMAVLIT